MRADVSTAEAPGRSCPLHYRYDPALFDSAAPPHLRELEVLYVVGGLYGNAAALARVLALFEREQGRKRLIFNGDFHWFDSEPQAFAGIQQQVLAFEATRGNVETELGDESAAAEGGAGCGCAYPDWVGEGVVERSNRIHARLRTATTREQRCQLATLPMWLRADVGGLRIAVVHGDATSLAGWGFAQEHLADAAHRAEVRRWLARANVHAFACSHTCLPVFQRLHTDAGERWVLNNGAAGMPNFRGERSGLVTRIATRAWRGRERRFGVHQAGVHHEALALEWDAAAFDGEFLRLWPPGSDAFASYFERIQRGPDYTPAQAVRDDIEPRVRDVAHAR
ncbi:MAG: metallophosphoesterase family protein [Burkholderiales bacterium]|nr:metallophosphoesterase family protein [Burkholderiales bacterium]